MVFIVVDFQHGNLLIDSKIFSIWFQASVEVLLQLKVPPTPTSPQHAFFDRHPSFFVYVIFDPVTLIFLLVHSAASR